MFLPGKYKENVHWVNVQSLNFIDYRFIDECVLEMWMWWDYITNVIQANNGINNICQIDRILYNCFYKLLVCVYISLVTSNFCLFYNYFICTNRIMTLFYCLAVTLSSLWSQNCDEPFDFITEKLCGWLHLFLSFLVFIVIIYYTFC